MPLKMSFLGILFMFCLFQKVQTAGDVCPVGKFGSGCLQTCHCANNYYCNKIDGYCSDRKCEAGYKGDDCQTECSDGKFGSGCMKSCHCAYSTKCNKTNGECSDGKCAAGYEGDDCQTKCPSGKFGSGCLEICHCADNYYCRKADGKCTYGKCEAGYMGDNCQTECQSGTFGSGCSKTCHCSQNVDCNKANGICSNGKCAVGYKGDDCQTSACPSDKFGSGCSKTCHCENNRDCSRTDGRCIQGKCAAGYMGDNCQTVCQVGTFGSGCSKTCHCVNNDYCSKTTGYCSDSKCEAGYRGYYCQTECSDGKFGSGCVKSCHCAYSTKCSKTNGRCSDGECAAGYEGDDCQTVCPVGKFGSGCLQTCHCENNYYCNKKNGHCSYKKCEAGYRGDYCQTVCPVGTFGSGCLKTCHCENNNYCHKTDGYCSGSKCEAGYRGDDCQTVCPVGKFGSECLQTCHCANNYYCNKKNGYCSDKKCEAGYRGDDCQTECLDGKFGSGCVKSCHCAYSTKCNKTNGRCSDGKCAAGYEGDDCQTVCPVGKFGNGCLQICHCENYNDCDKKNGYCYDRKCAAGYRGDDCQTECQDGTFGKGCSKTCNCVNINSCNKTNGKCSSNECQAGYMGDDCQTECSDGKFGSGCEKSCHCTYSTKCSKTNGKCSDGKCAAGYEGDDCQTECPEGKFGSECVKSCHCADNTKCNKTNGRCSQGKCAALYKGDDCQHVDFGFILPIIVVPILIISILIGLAIYCRKRISKRCFDKKVISETNISMEARTDFETDNIYQNSQVLTKHNFLTYLEKCKMEEEPFSDEFLKLFKTTNYKCEAGSASENTMKNRYKTILPYDHSRVVLSSDDESFATDYINANYINMDTQYIAAQGPLESTITDFWRMIWQENCNTIIMVTNFVENGKVKCSAYCLDENETETYGNFQIKCLETKSSIVYTYRVLTITECTLQEERYVHHFQCTSWPDHGVPEDPIFFLEFRNKVRNTLPTRPPFVVHCSAGIGRTGSYIALDILLEQLRTQSTIDVFSCVNELRHQRGLMVQRRIQYEFIFDVLAEEILTGFSEIYVNSISDVFYHLMSNKTNGISDLKSQYQKFVFPLIRSHRSRVAASEEPVYTNVNILEAVYSNNFQEHIYINGVNMENEIILTFQPNKNTAAKFWTFIYEKRCSTVVMLEPSSNLADVCLPQTVNSTQVFGSVQVELISVTEKETYFHRCIKVSSTKQNSFGPVSLVHFQSKVWQGQKFPAPSDLIDLIQDVTKCCGQGKQLLVSCKNGIRKSGLFSILCVMVCKMKMYEQVSILRLIRLMKKKTPQLIIDYDAYEFCWLVAEVIQNEISIYSN